MPFKIGEATHVIQSRKRSGYRPHVSKAEREHTPPALAAVTTDFERGFIAGEIVHYADLVELGSYAKCREKGKLRIEGKEYVMKDGDVVEFRFNV